MPTDAGRAGAGAAGSHEGPDGNDLREWQAGKAWAFDDTIEHEAWNSGTETRVILIFDIWRPELSEEERGLVAALMEAVDSYPGGAPVSWNA